MDRIEAEKCIRDYFEAWKTGNRELFLRTLSPDAVICECYGPVYETTAQADAWFTRWFADGGKVLAWDITDVIFDEVTEQAAVTWYFKCDYEREVTDFYGCSTFQFKEDKIYSLSEYKMDKGKKEPLEGPA